MSGHEPDLDPANNIYSTHSRIDSSLRVENNSTASLHVYELTRAPGRHLVGMVPPGTTSVFSSSIGTAFVIKDLKTGYYQLVYAEFGGRHIELRDEDIDRAFWYDDESFHGWNINLCQDMSPRDPITRQAALEIVRASIAFVERQVPSARLMQIRKIPIWVELNNGDGTARFHRDEAAMIRAGDDLFKLGCVEVTNAINFVRSNKSQPFALLHELAHALHHFWLTGAERDAIKNAYDNAVASRKHESLHHKDNTTQPARALTSAFEYFAELTMTFFGENEHEPFDRKQLVSFDAMGLQMIRKTWKVESGTG